MRELGPATLLRIRLYIFIVHSLYCYDFTGAQIEGIVDGWRDKMCSRVCVNISGLSSMSSMLFRDVVFVNISLVL